MSLSLFFERLREAFRRPYPFRTLVAVLVCGTLLTLFAPALLTRAVNAHGIRVSVDHFVTASGDTLQLRGVNVSGLEFVAIQGWDPQNPWGDQVGPGDPDWSTVKSWKANVVRIPLNEASWLGYTTTDEDGKSRDPDPGHNYQATVIRSVQDATDAGLYVILDLHWSAPSNFSPIAQNPMADVDHSIAFWKSVAGTFKDNPAVIFEPFNEPYFWWIKNQPWEQNQWSVWKNGGTFTRYVAGGNPYQKSYEWQSAGMQQMVDAIRSTGATNVIIVDGVDWSNDLSGWLENVPSDPVHQLAAGWHVYSGQPHSNDSGYDVATNITSHRYPVIITETGDHNAPGTPDAPFVSQVLPWADEHNVSYLGWGWDVWENPDNVLLKDASGTPTDGYGVYVKQHFADRESVAPTPSDGSQNPAPPPPPPSSGSGSSTPPSGSGSGSDSTPPPHDEDASSTPPAGTSTPPIHSNDNDHNATSSPHGGKDHDNDATSTEGGGILDHLPDLFPPLAHAASSSVDHPTSTPPGDGKQCHWGWCVTN